MWNHSESCDTELQLQTHKYQDKPREAGKCSPLNYSESGEQSWLQQRMKELALEEKHVQLFYQQQVQQSAYELALAKWQALQDECAWERKFGGKGTDQELPPAKNKAQGGCTVFSPWVASPVELGKAKRL